MFRMVLHFYPPNQGCSCFTNPYDLPLQYKVHLSSGPLCRSDIQEKARKAVLDETLPARSCHNVTNVSQADSLWLHSV